MHRIRGLVHEGDDLLHGSVALRDPFRDVIKILLFESRVHLPKVYVRLERRQLGCSILACLSVHDAAVESNDCIEAASSRKLSPSCLLAASSATLCVTQYAACQLRRNRNDLDELCRGTDKVGHNRDNLAEIVLRAPVGLETRSSRTVCRNRTTQLLVELDGKEVSATRNWQKLETNGHGGTEKGQTPP